MEGLLPKRKSSLNLGEGCSTLSSSDTRKRKSVKQLKSNTECRMPASLRSFHTNMMKPQQRILFQSCDNNRQKCAVISHADYLLVFSFFIYLCFMFYVLFIYFWLHWVFVAACGLSRVALSGGYSSLRCAGFSLPWFLLLQSVGSRRTGFSSCGTRAQ